MPLTRFLRLYGDWALALGLAALVQIEVSTIDPSHPPGDVGADGFASGERVVAAATGLVLTFSLAWRRRAPLAALAAAIATSVAASVLAVLDEATTPAIALVVAAYRRGLREQRGRKPRSGGALLRPASAIPDRIGRSPASC